MRVVRTDYPTGMAKLTYNDVVLSFVDTQSIEQNFVRDPTNSEHLYVHYRIRVRTIITRGQPPLETDPTDEDPATGTTRLVEKLRLPRRRLIYESDDGETLLDTQDTTKPVGDGEFYSLDDANGPFPLYANISQVTTETFILEFGVEAKMRIPCPDSGLSFPSGEEEGVLSLRWSESTSYDSKWLCTRRRVGFLVMSGYYSFAPDRWRDLVTPRVPAGFRRESAHYEISDDNLTYRFTFVDKEMMRAPPAPAIRMRGRMIESTPQLGGAVRWGEITIALDGPKGVDRLDLLSRAIRIAMSRVQAAGVVKTQQGMAIVNGSVAESLNDDDNSIELSVRWMMKPNGQRIAGTNPIKGAIASTLPGAGAAADAVQAAANGNNNNQVPIFQPNNIGKNALGLPAPTGWVGLPLPNTDPERSIQPPIFGSDDRVKLVAAILHDPCGAALVPPKEVDKDTVEIRTVYVPPATVSPLPQDGTEPALYAGANSDFDLPGVYEVYRVTSHYTHSSGECVEYSSKKMVAPANTDGNQPAAIADGMKIRYSAPSLTLRCEWEATRIGTPPELPDPSECPESWVYLGGTVSAGHLDLAADGVTPVHKVAGVYEYAALNPRNVWVNPAIPPFLDNSSNGPMLDQAKKGVKKSSRIIIFPFNELYSPNGNIFHPKYSTQVQGSGPGSTPVQN